MKTHTFIAFVTIVLLSVSCGYSNSEKKLDNQVNTESGIIFFDGSLEEALKLSATTNKPIMMDVATSWCSYCKKMKKYTFTDKEAAAYFNNNFINLEIDAEVGEGIAIAQKWQVASYPTLIFIDKNQKLLLFSEGYLKPKGLIESGEMALKNLHK